MEDRQPGVHGQQQPPGRWGALHVDRCLVAVAPLTALPFLQGGWEEAVRFFDSLCHAHGVVRANAVTFGIMMNAYLARDEPHKVWGKCEGGPWGEGGRGMGPGR